MDRDETPRDATSTIDPPRSLDDFLEETYHHRHRLYPPPLLTALAVANSSDATEILCLSYILSDENFFPNQHNALSSGVLAAAVFAGMLVGGLLVGAAGDIRGRHSMLVTGLRVNACAGILSSLAPTLSILTLWRFLAGLGIGATVPPLFTLASEWAPPSRRGLYVTYVASFWMVGSIYVAIVGWWVLSRAQVSWRWLAALSAIPSAVGSVWVQREVQESPRFLALQGQTDDAVRVANHIAHSMGLPRSRYWRPSEAQQCYPTSTATSHPDTRNLLGQCRDFLSSFIKLYSPSLLQTSLLLQLIWFTLSFGSYGLMTWINTLFFRVHLKNVYTNALLFALANLPGNIISALLMDVVGRGKLLSVSVLLASLSLLAFAYVTSQEGHVSKVWIVVAACTFQGCTVAAWNCIDTITTESFPTTCRSTGMGSCTATGRVGAMIAQIVNGLLVGRPTRLLVVSAVMLLLGAMAPAMIPDKTGQAVSDELTTLALPSYQRLQSNGEELSSVPYRDNA